MDVANRRVVSDDQTGKLLVMLVIEHWFITSIMDVAHTVQSQRFEKSNNGALLVPVLNRKAFDATAATEELAI
jgi:hypothetical protein